MQGIIVMPCIHSSGSRCDAKMNSIECGDNEWRKRGYFFLNASQPQSSRSEKKQKRELEPPAPESGPQQETIAEAASACASRNLELKRNAPKTACCTAVKSSQACSDSGPSCRATAPPACGFPLQPGGAESHAGLAQEAGAHHQVGLPEVRAEIAE